MLTRRTLLATLAALPLFGWRRPKASISDADGGFLVPKEFSEAIESGAICTKYYVVPLESMTLQQCAWARNIYLTPELAKDEEMKATIVNAAFKKLFSDQFCGQEEA